MAIQWCRERVARRETAWLEPLSEPAALEEGTLHRGISRQVRAAVPTPDGVWRQPVAGDSHPVRTRSGEGHEPRRARCRHRRGAHVGRSDVPVRRMHLAGGGAGRQAAGTYATTKIPPCGVHAAEPPRRRPILPVLSAWVAGRLRRVRGYRRAGTRLCWQGNGLAATLGPSGYAQIQPRNCFKGGQSTNCKVNHRILLAAQDGLAVRLWIRQTASPGPLEERLIAKLAPPWNDRR